MGALLTGLSRKDGLRKMGPGLMIFLFLSAFSVMCQAAGRSPAIGHGIYGYVNDRNGSPLAGADVFLFDGFTTENVKTDINGSYEFPEPSVSSGRYAVIYFRNRGFVPQAVNIKMPEEGGIKRNVVLDSAGSMRSSFIIGSVFKPIRGGKIEFQSGIYSFIQGGTVLLESAIQSIKVDTDEDGHFLLEVPPGRYRVRMQGGRDTAEVDVSAGETIIQNLRSGMILVD